MSDQSSTAIMPTEAEALAEAVRGFLSIPLVERGVAAGPAWAKEWLARGDLLRIGDLLPLADALAQFDAAQNGS